LLIEKISVLDRITGLCRINKQFSKSKLGCPGNPVILSIIFVSDELFSVISWQKIISANYFVKRETEKQIFNCRRLTSHV